MKDSPDLGGCPPRPSAFVDNTLRDLQNSSYPTKAVFNNYFIIHSKYFLFLKGFCHFALCFSAHQTEITQSRPQVNGQLSAESGTFDVIG